MEDPETVITGLPLLLQSIGSIVASATSWIGDYLEMLTADGNELLLLCAIFGFVGAGIGLLQRLLRVN